TLERRRRHAKHRLLGLVRIGDEAAIHDVGRAGDFGERAGDKPAGAGFRSRDLQAAGSTEVQHLRGLLAQDALDHARLQGNRTVAVAIATIPSARPVKPIFSDVVALIATRSIGTPAMAAMRARMASRCGPTRGASQTMVTSRCAIMPPRARTRSHAKARKRSDEAPRHCGSLG